MRLLALSLSSVLLLAAADWTRFRGPNGTGLSPETGLPAEISRDRNVLWKAKTLPGHSSPIVAQGRVWFTAYEGDERIVLCYDAATGAFLWRRGVIKARTEAANPLNGPATPTPATDGWSIFVFFPEFGLLAYDFDGQERWRVPLGPFGGVQSMAVSPVYAEGNVVLCIDTPEQAYLAAFDATTGKQVWKAERPIGFLGGYATPSLYQPASGPAQIVVAGALQLTGYAARTGERLWWARGVTQYPAALPLVAGDSVYTIEPYGDEGGPSFKALLDQYDKNKNGRIELAEVPTERLNDQIMARIFKSIDQNIGNHDGAVSEDEYNRAFDPSSTGGGLVQTRLTGHGDVSKTLVRWRHTKGLPYVTAPLLYQNVLYVIRNGGILSTFDPETGQVLREERLKDAVGDYYAQPVAGDGKIYLFNHDGKVSVLRAGKTWELLSSGDLDETVIATPAIAGGRLYVRTDTTLYCFGMKR